MKAVFWFPYAVPKTCANVKRKTIRQALTVNQSNYDPDPVDERDYRDMLELV
jgi:hypothetical protein